MPSTARVMPRPANRPESNAEAKHRNPRCNNAGAGPRRGRAASAGRLDVRLPWCESSRRIRIVHDSSRQLPYSGERSWPRPNAKRAREEEAETGEETPSTLGLCPAIQGQALDDAGREHKREHKKRKL